MFKNYNSYSVRSEFVRRGLLTTYLLLACVANQEVRQIKTRPVGWLDPVSHKDQQHRVEDLYSFKENARLGFPRM